MSNQGHYYIQVNCFEANGKNSYPCTVRATPLNSESPFHEAAVMKDIPLLPDAKHITSLLHSSLTYSFLARGKGGLFPQGFWKLLKKANSHLA